MYAIAWRLNHQASYLVNAQSAADGTLPTPTGVTTTNNLDFTIGDGSRIAANLFHSFDIDSDSVR